MPKLLYYSIVVSLAGFLFGFDTVVISGAEQALALLWDRGPVFHGWVVMSSALWGTVLGAMMGGMPLDRYGRKSTLIVIGILYLLSALGSAMSSDPWIFAAMRFIGGIGIGASTVAAPAYVSEIAPPAQRGRLVALYQFNIVLGILIAFVSNFLLRNIPGESWRWMIGIEAIPAALYTIMVVFVIESPRWIITKYGDENRARKLLLRVFDMDYVETLMTEIKQSIVEGVRDSVETIFMPKYRRSLSLAFFVAFFNQFSGINAFLYYAPRIFETAGLGDEASFMSGIGVGIVNLVFTLVGMSLIDKFGRRQLLLYGSVGYIVSLGLVACAFLLGWQGILVPILFFLFIASHAVGQGAVIWVLIAEIFPDHLRASGQSFGTSVHWVLAAIIPASVPFLFQTIGAGLVFLIFMMMMVGQLIWVLYYVPETKGKSIEQIQRLLIKV